MSSRVVPAEPTGANEPVEDLIVVPPALDASSSQAAAEGAAEPVGVGQVPADGAGATSAAPDETVVADRFDQHGAFSRPAPVAAEPVRAEPEVEPADAPTWAAEPWAAAPAPVTAPDEADVEDDDAPTPLAAAVDRTTSWLRKAGSATTTKVTSAYASITRPAPEDTTMTSTNTASGPLGDVEPDDSWSVGTSRPIVPGPRAITTDHTGTPRRARLVVARVDPWSVMKLSFLLSFALGIIGVVATAVVWLTLDGLHVFAQLNSLVSTVAGSDSSGQVLSYFSFGKVIAGAMLVGVVDVFLLTAMATIAAFLYNIVAALVGGLHVTMTDD